MKVCKSVMIKKKITIRLRRSNEAKAERLLTAMAKFKKKTEQRAEDGRSEESAADYISKNTIQFHV